MALLGAPIVVDGSHGEGGGALLRTSLAMAALTQQPLRLERIRGATQYPGLDIEDILLVQALAQSCAAETTGIEQGSPAISFLPTRRPRGLSLSLDPELPVGRRGANALVILHALLPVLARSGMYSRVEVVGETYGHHALSYDYFAGVTTEALKRFGIHSFPAQIRAGFGRESQGLASIEVEPSAIEGIEWQTKGRLVEARAVVATSQLASTIAARGVAHLKSLAQYAGVPLKAHAVTVESDRPGAHITVWARYENGLGGGNAMGAKGVRIETLAQTAFQHTLDWIASDATVDPFLADQILIPAALAENGCSFKTSRLTQRFMTSVWVIKQFLPIHLTVKGVLDGPGEVTVRK